MTTLLSPANNQPSEFISVLRGHVQLRCDQVTPMTRWFTIEAIQACNPIATCAEPPTYYTVPENIYPQALWLGIANGILEMSKRKLDVRVAIATSELAVAA